ncbi:LOW QUALITY PROTEIN: hypothetical protein YC2023_122697 [Brassica napus]
MDESHPRVISPPSSFLYSHAIKLSSPPNLRPVLWRILCREKKRYSHNRWREIDWLFGCVCNRSSRGSGRTASWSDESTLFVIVSPLEPRTMIDSVVKEIDYGWETLLAVQVGGASKREGVVIMSEKVLFAEGSIFNRVSGLASSEHGYFTRTNLCDDAANIVAFMLLAFLCVKEIGTTKCLNQIE